MKKIVRLTENDLTRIVKKVINEQSDEFQRRSDKVKNKWICYLIYQIVTQNR